MAKIFERYYPDVEANDNCLVMAPMWDGWKFLGFQPVKGNWKQPCEYVEVRVD